MATWTATSTATLASRISSDAAGGDIIELEGGVYLGWYWDTSKTFSPPITVRAKSRLNPPIFRSHQTTFTGGSKDYMWYLVNLNGVIFDGIEFDGYDGGDGKDTYGFPTRSAILLNTGCHNITIRNCLFDFLYRGISLQSTTTAAAKFQNITITRNTWNRNGMDCLQVYRGVDGFTITNNLISNNYIDIEKRVSTDDDIGRHHNDLRHPDGFQFGWFQKYPSAAGSNVLIKQNYIEGNKRGDCYMHGIFLFNEQVQKTSAYTGDTYRWNNVEISENYLDLGWTHGITLCGVRGTIKVERNCMRQLPGTVFGGKTLGDGKPTTKDYRPKLNIMKGVGSSTNKVQVNDNVWPSLSPGAFGDGTPASVMDNVSFGTGNLADQISTTAFPRGWPVFTYGRYSEGTVTPTKPGALESARVSMSGTPYDAGQVEFADGTYQAYSGTIVVLNTSVAWNTDPAKVEFQWRATSEGVNSWKPMRVATPSKNAANSTRYEMRSDYDSAKAASDAGFPGAHRLHARKAGGVTMSGISLRWRPAGSTTWSDEGGFTISFTTPATATAPNISAVTLNNSAYTVGQTATAALTYTLGSGSFISHVVDWMLGSTIVETDTLTSTDTSAAYTTTAVGSLTARATLVTSAGTSTLTSAVASVTASAVAPDVTAVTLNKSTYAVGEVAAATITYTAGNGTGLALSYQWRRSGVAISGATSATYTTTSADVGAGTLTCTGTATTSAGTDTMVSAASSVAVSSVAPVVSAVTLNKSTYAVGEVAVATIAYTAGNGANLALTYQWRRNGVAIPGAASSSSYTTTVADTGTGTLTCTGSVTTSAGTSSATSAASSVTTSVTAPEITSVTLSNSAYNVGQTAVVNFTANLGSGTFTSLAVDWLLGASVVRTDGLASTVRTASYTTTAAGILTTRVRIVTSAGSAALTSAAATVQAAPATPDVTSVTLSASSYTIGQTADATYDYTLGTGTFDELRVSWHLTGASPKPRPAPDPAIVAIAAAAPDYICAHTNSSGAVIGEGTSTAYHNLVPEIIGLDVWRGGMGNRARLATQLRRFLATDRDPTGKGGLATQYDIHAALAILCAKLAPGGWWTSEFTGTERGKFDLIMAGMAYGAAFSGSASANSSVSLTGEQNQPKNTPNWRTSIPATLWAWAAYRGGYGTPDITGVLADLGSFSKSAFYTSVNGAGLTNLATTFRARGGSTGFSGPTNAVVEAALDSWQFIARSGTTHWALSDIAGILKAELEFCFSNTIEAGLNGGVGVTYNNDQRGIIMSGAETLPNVGLVGMLHQLATTDGGGANSSLTARSAMSYAMRTYNNAADLVLTCIIGGIYDPATLTGAAVLADRCSRGVVDFAYKHDKGYKSFSKGGGTSNNENWTSTDSMVVSNRVPVQLSVWWDIVDPALRGDGKVATTRPANGTKTSSYVPEQSGSLSTRVYLETTAGVDVMTSAAVPVTATATAPTITSVTLDNAAYTVGQTAVATFEANMGSGAFTSLVVEWLLNGSLVETDTLTSAVRTASYTTTAAGTLVPRVRAVNSAGTAVLSGAAATITAAAVAPDVTSVTLSGSSFTVGQTAVATFVLNLGNGTFTSLAVEWLLNGSLVETDNLASTVRTASYTTTAAGTLTYQVRAVTSAGTDTMVSAPATVVPAAVAPDVTAVTIANSAYAVGQTAIANFAVTMGNGAHASLEIDWSLGATIVETASLDPAVRTASYQTTAPGSLTAQVRAATSAGSDAMTSAPVQVYLPAPAALTDAQWEIVEVVSAPGLANRFTAELRLLISDADVTGVDWTANGVAWRPCILIGTDAQGYKVWQLGPGTAGETAHTVGFSEVSPLIRIRVSTAGGTSPISTGAGKAFQGLVEPPSEDPDLPAPTAADWALAPIAVAHTGQFSGRVMFQGIIVPDDVVSAQWTSADGFWRPLVKVAGAYWDMRPLPGEPEAHLVPYGGATKSIRIRYTTATASSGISATKLLAAPASPPGYMPGQQTGEGAIAGAVIRTAGLVIPGTPDGEIAVETPLDDPTAFAFTSPALPVGATHMYLLYADRVRQITPQTAVREARVAGQGMALIVAVDAVGTNGRRPGAESIARYIPVP